MAEPHPLDDPETRWRAVKALLVAAPCSFAGCYFLALIQGAETSLCLLIAGVATALCLAAALVIHLMGSKSWMALVAVKIALLLVRR